MHGKIGVGMTREIVKDALDRVVEAPEAEAHGTEAQGMTGVEGAWKEMEDGTEIQGVMEDLNVVVAILRVEIAECT